jgi:putative redox protein
VGTPVPVLSDGLRLAAWVSRPAGATQRALPGLVLCHGVPLAPQGLTGTAPSCTQLADQLATEAGCVVLTFEFRGVGESEGNFSLGGWRADLAAAVAHLRREEHVRAVLLAGFSTGAALVLCRAGEDERVAGVAALGAPADFHEWASDPHRVLARARAAGIIRDRSFPPDYQTWARELRDIRALALIGGIPPRPILIVHGSDDELVPPMDARALVDAADGAVELRVLTGAGHRLRDDPRAVALLLGWLDRQAASAL